MALISASTILRSVALFHITLGYFFLTSPMTVADQTIVFVVGQAMDLPAARPLESKSPAMAFLGVLFIFLGLSDLISTSLPEEMYQAHWGMQSPIRVAIFFALCFYSYGFSRNAPMMTKSYANSGWGEGLKNRVFFTWAFVEMMLWFWTFATLREERKVASMRAAAKRTLEDTS